MPYKEVEILNRGSGEKEAKRGKEEVRKGSKTTFRLIILFVETRYQLSAIRGSKPASSAISSNHFLRASASRHILSVFKQNIKHLKCGF